MKGGGRPLRFLAALLVGWTGGRIAVLWTMTGRPPTLLPSLLPMARGAVSIPARPSPARVPVSRVTLAARPRLMFIATRRSDPGSVASGQQRKELALAAPLQIHPQRLDMAMPLIVSPAAETTRPKKSRWSGDVWLLARGGTMRGVGFGAGQLGGSQAGVRLAYAIGRSRRVALVGRLDTPLHGKGREAALGVEWRPKGLPARLVAEERVPLDGGKAAPAIGAIAGLNPTPLTAGFRLEAYGQAGALDRDGVQGFADGAARATHVLFRIGMFTPDLGGGFWGAAQRGAARFDLGPTLGLGFRLGKLPARLTIDWRQRVAGRARPGSGLAVALGAGF